MRSKGTKLAEADWVDSSGAVIAVSTISSVNCVLILFQVQVRSTPGMCGGGSGMGAYPTPSAASVDCFLHRHHKIPARAAPNASANGMLMPIKTNTFGATVVEWGG